MYRDETQTNILNNTFAMSSKTRQESIRFTVDPLTCIHIASRHARVVAEQHYPRVRIDIWQPTRPCVVVLGPSLPPVPINIMYGDDT